LHVKGGARVNEFDDQRRQGYDRQNQERDGNSEKDVERPFQQPVLPVAEVAPDFDAGH
jgi:hypothetical protein